jgi:hypothetical protein
MSATPLYCSPNVLASSNQSELSTVHRIHTCVHGCAVAYASSSGPDPLTDPDDVTNARDTASFGLHVSRHNTFAQVVNHLALQVI